MSHYPAERWVDFVRGLLKEDERAAMEKHMDEGCESCRREVDVLQVMRNFAREEAGAEPPADVVRLARAIYVPPKQESALRRLLGRLVFDSFAQPAVAGVRQAGVAGQQMAFEAGEYYIDLRLQREPDSSRVALAGQIVRRDATNAELRGLIVALQAGRKVVTETVSNEFGEFSLEFFAGKNHRLRISLPDDGIEVIVPLEASPEEDPDVA
jgi:hypothetical protein